MPIINVTDKLPEISIGNSPGLGRSPGSEFFIDFKNGLTIYEDDGSSNPTGYFLPNKQFKRIVKLISDVHEASGGSIKDWFADGA